MKVVEDEQQQQDWNSSQDDDGVDDLVDDMGPSWDLVVVDPNLTMKTGEDEDRID